jgi:hypothetical protein
MDGFLDQLEVAVLLFIKVIEVLLRKEQVSD